MTGKRMDVPAFLRSLPIGAVFTHARPHEKPNSWIKIGDNEYRRTYSSVRSKTDDFREWTRAELTEPVDYSITQEGVDRMQAHERSRPGPREMGQ